MTTRRFFRYVTRSLAALATLLLLVGGIPAALVATVGWPLPRSVPRLGDITSALGGQSIDDAFLVKALALVCWLAWAQFVACVGVEIIGWRHGRAPRAVPFAGALQPLVAQLVVTAALLVHLTPRPSSSAPVLLSAAPVVHVHHPAPATVAEVAPVVVTEPEPAAASATTYVVKPRDDLWSLAETHLGDGRRWRELFDLNRDRPQAHSGALRRPNLIRPGWVLQFPHDAVGLADPGATPPAESKPPGAPEPTPVGGPAVAATVIAEPAAPAPACPDASPAASSPVTALAETPTAAPTSDPPPVTPPTNPPAPTDGRPATAATTGVPSPVTPLTNPVAPTGGQPPTPEAANEPTGPRAPVGILGASLLAAGVVVTLDRLRRAQQRRRPPDRMVRMPTEAAIPTEVAVRRAAHTSPAARLDLALRAFARLAARRQAGDPPAVSAVQVGPQEIEILLSNTIEADPGPFTIDAAGQVWALPAAVADADLEDGTHDIGAPLPALVSIGKHGDAAVLIDLEATACTAIIGDQVPARAAFHAITLELATSLWADTLDVVVVAADAQAFQPLERIRVAGTLAEILPDVEAAAGELSDALAGLSAPTTLAARLGATAADGWVPTVVLCEDPASDPDAFARLLALAGSGARGLAVVALGEVPDAGRTLRFHDDTVEATPPGVTLTITGPTPKQVVELEEILTAAADCAGVEAEPDSLTAAAERPADALVLDAPFGEQDFDVLVRLMGPVEIEGVKQPIDRRKAVELVVYLATHPRGLDDERLKTALWPDERAPQASFNTTVTRARSRLGTAADGSYHLPHVIASGGVYRVGPGVTTDIVLLERRLVAARAAAPEAAMRILRAGLELVRGLPMAGARQGYEWAYAEGLVARIETVVGDAAHHLAQLALEARDPDVAQWAACQGLLASPADEVLYRDRMLACDLAGNPAGVETVMDELVAAAEALEPYDTLHPETVALYERLSHRRRRTG
jgi:LysM repeat protein